jgi:hypothetical protein
MEPTPACSAQNWAAEEPGSGQLPDAEAVVGIAINTTRISTSEKRMNNFFIESSLDSQSVQPSVNEPA